MINEFYLKQSTLEKLKKEFRTNKPFPYVVLKEVFKEEIIESLKGEIKKEHLEKQESDLFSFEQSKDLEFTKNEKLKEFYDKLNSKEFKKFIKEITGISCEGVIDASVFIYRDGDYLLPHDDHLEKRKIAYVLNLTSLKKEEGGSLDFFNKENSVKSIIPSKNSFIIFEVMRNKTIHQVAEVTNAERITISGWFNDQ